MSPQLAIVIVMVVAVVGWFALGTQMNVRKGDRVMRWLQSGLPILGQKTTLRWLGSSVAQLTIEHADPPFRRAEVLIVLEPRDVPFLWAAARVRNRRDTLILRTETRRIQAYSEFDIVDPHAWTARDAVHNARSKNWQPQAAAGDLVAYTPGGSKPMPPEIYDQLSHAGLSIARLSARKTGHKLELHAVLGDYEKHSAATVFEALRNIAQRL